MLGVLPVSGVEYDYSDDQFVAEVEDDTVTAESVEELDAKVQSILSKSAILSEEEEEAILQQNPRIQQYQYSGCIYDSNDHIVFRVPSNNPMFTAAVSQAKAAANIKHRVRKMLGLPRNAGIHLDTTSLTERSV